MLELNYYILIGTSFIPLIIGSIWYNPKVFGNIWIKETGLTEEQLKQSNMLLIFGLTILLGFFVSVAMLPATIHQMSVYSVVQGNPDLNNPSSELSLWIKQYMDKYGTNFRSFKHGALHGTISAIVLALPIISILGMFERKSFKYIAIHTGYWIVTLALIGGIICAFC